MEQKIFGLNFYPGVAEERLDILAKGKTKTGVIKRLIDEVPWPLERDFMPYINLTRAGRAIKKHSGNMDFVLKKGNEALEICRGFKYEVAAGGSRKILDKPRGQGCFHLNLGLEQMSKLEVLGNRSGLSKTMVLRFLILGLRLPDRLAMRMAGRMNQIGGLLRHIAWMKKTGVWREVVSLSFAISSIGFEIAVQENRGAEVNDGYGHLQTR